MSSCWSLIVMVVCVSKFLGTVTISGVWQMGSLGVGPLNLGGMIKPLGPVGLGRNWLVSRNLSTLVEGSEARFERLEGNREGQFRCLVARFEIWIQIHFWG